MAGSLIGSDPVHSAWCRKTAKACVDRTKDQLGNAWTVLGPQVRNAFVMEKVCGLILLQDGETAPLWRMQELVQAAVAALSDLNRPAVARLKSTTPPATPEVP